jgi:hypothetical protein
MLLFIIRMLYILVGFGSALTYVFSTNSPRWVQQHPFIAFALMLLVILGFLLIDILIPRKRVEIMSAGC